MFFYKILNKYNILGLIVQKVYEFIKIFNLLKKYQKYY